MEGPPDVAQQMATRLTVENARRIKMAGKLGDCKQDVWEGGNGQVHQEPHNPTIVDAKGREGSLVFL